MVPKKDRKYYIKSSHGSAKVSMDGPFDATVLRQKVLAGQLAPTSELYDAEDNTVVTAASLFPELGAALGNGFLPPPRPLVIKAKGDVLLSAALSKNAPVVENTAHIEKKQAYFLKLNGTQAKKEAVPSGQKTDQKTGEKKFLKEFTRTIIRESKRLKVYSAQSLNPFTSGSAMISASLALIAAGVYGFVHFKDAGRTRGLAGNGSAVAPTATGAAAPTGTGAAAGARSGTSNSSEMPLATGDAIGKGNNPVNRDIGATVSSAVNAAATTAKEAEKAAQKDAQKTADAAAARPPAQDNEAPPIAAGPGAAERIALENPNPNAPTEANTEASRDPAQLPSDGSTNNPSGETYHIDPASLQGDTSTPVNPPNFSDSYADPNSAAPGSDPASVPIPDQAPQDPNAVPPSPDPEAGTTY